MYTVCIFAFIRKYVSINLHHFGAVPHDRDCRSLARNVIILSIPDLWESEGNGGQ